MHNKLHTYWLPYPGVHVMQFSRPCEPAELFDHAAGILATTGEALRQIRHKGGPGSRTDAKERKAAITRWSWVRDNAREISAHVNRRLEADPSKSVKIVFGQTLPSAGEEVAA